MNEARDTCGLERPVFQAARLVSSNQRALHPRLEQRVSVHLERPWQQPLHGPTVAAFDALLGLCGPQLERSRLILDSGCGTGESTRGLAARYPKHIVLGVDRSHHRLRRTGLKSFPGKQGNIVWIRADLATFWRLALVREWALDLHALYYPNPWPKAAQLARRWHGHPVFPYMLALGGVIELRCNWKVYADEFSRAVGMATGVSPKPRPVKDRVNSRFETKYAASGHPLYQVSVSAESTNAFRGRSLAKLEAEVYRLGVTGAQRQSITGQIPVLHGCPATERQAG